MKWIWLTLFLLVSAAAAADDAPRFFIERIDVRNLRFASAAIIRAELRLPAGHEYTEDELRRASDRVNRLPFVLDSEFSLEKGSSRGAYVLVIAVTETKPLFYSGEVGWNFNRYTDIGVLKDPRTTGTVGGRVFLGSVSEAHVAFTEQHNPGGPQIESLQGGVTRYGLFGSSAFAQLNVSAPLSGPFRSVTPEVLVGIPLGPTRTLSVSYSTTQDSFRQPDLGLRTRVKDQFLQASLAYNTTDEPFFPTRGAILSITPGVDWTDLRTTVDGFGGQPFDVVSRARQQSVIIQGVRYLPLDEASSLSTLASVTRSEANFGHGNQPSSDDSGVVDLGFIHRFRLGNGHRESREMGLELHARYSALRLVGGGSGPAFPPVTEAFTALTAAWAFRNPWGALRLGAMYVRGPRAAAPQPPFTPARSLP